MDSVLRPSPKSCLSDWAAEGLGPWTVEVATGGATGVATGSGRCCGTGLA